MDRGSDPDHAEALRVPATPNGLEANFMGRPCPIAPGFKTMTCLFNHPYDTILRGRNGDFHGASAGPQPKFPHAAGAAWQRQNVLQDRRAPRSKAPPRWLRPDWPSCPGAAVRAVLGSATLALCGVPRTANRVNYTLNQSDCGFFPNEGWVRRRTGTPWELRTFIHLRDGRRLGSLQED